jgi:predicted TIM-barrel fold metal-dependent hydrolase
LTVIDLFGPHRTLFESNFPVDRSTVSYDVLWNAFKRITGDFTPDERSAMFAGTAKRAYRLDAIAISG